MSHSAIDVHLNSYYIHTQ